MFSKIFKAFSGAGLQAKALRASVWSVIGFGSRSVLRLLSTVILTRLLSPEAFGLLSLANVFVNGLKMFSDIGTRASVIRSERGEEEVFLNTAWSVQITRNLIIAGVACLIAWPVSVLYDQPILFPLLCVLAIAVVIAGFQAIVISVYSRRLEYRRIAVFELVCQAATLIVTIIAAYQLRSVWALAVGSIAGSIVSVIVSHYWMSSFRHRFRIDRESFQEIFQYGRWILIGTVFTFLGGRGLQAIQGTFVSIETIGLIAIAMNIAMLPRELMGRISKLIGFPVFSEIQRERPEELRRLLSKFRRFFFSLAIPMFIGLSFIAQPLIDLLYDPRYAVAGSFLALMTLNIAISVVAMPYQNVMLSSGDSRTHALVMFVTATFQIVGVVVGFYLGGLFGMLLGGGISGMVTYAVSVSFAARRGLATFGLDFVVLLAIWASYLYAALHVTF